MDRNDIEVAMPRDAEGCALDAGILDALRSGYVRRDKDTQPRQGTKLPWRILHHYERDCRMLLKEPIDDGLLSLLPAQTDPPLLRRS